MPKNTKKRTQVKDLPKAKKKLTKDEAKKVRGGGGDDGPEESITFVYGKLGNIKPKSSIASGDPR